jgi:hypothetical protein
MMHPRRLISIGIVLGLAACSGKPLEQVRRAAYPPSFEYIEREEVRQEMRAIVRSVRRLDVALRSSTLEGEALRAEVVAELALMEQAISRLEPAGTRSNHPLIDANLGAFQTDVRAARETAERSPPSYYLAGAVAGACAYCHR